MYFVSVHKEGNIIRYKLLNTNTIIRYECNSYKMYEDVSWSLKPIYQCIKLKMLQKHGIIRKGQKGKEGYLTPHCQRQIGNPDDKQLQRGTLMRTTNFFFLLFGCMISLPKVKILSW